MRYIFYLPVLLLAAGSAFAKPKVKVVDGDSLFIGQREIRLSGIDAPEYKQMCYDEKNEPYPCGKEAYLALRDIVDDSLVCKKKSVDRYHREVADCFMGKMNVNREMVRLGKAVAYDRYTKDYVPAEKKARKHKRGIWRGRFMKPELYRRLHQN